MLVIIKENYEEISKEAARIIAELIQKKPHCVLGLATGSTPLGLYKELIRLHQEARLDFSQVTTFNLDEYVGLPSEHPQSYYHFMQENLFKHINMNLNSIHMPNGMAEDIEQECEDYEKAIDIAGGIDLQVLGVGANGHIAFNEPLSSLGSRTRIKTLTEKTRRDNARFFSSLEEVPKYAITMGVGTIMEARSIILLASGKSKAEAISKTVEGPITAMVPATMVQMHPRATIIVDVEAASLLSREWI
ncbi:MAG: glucosamine-6-phosphate deaminase [bacterium]